MGPHLARITSNSAQEPGVSVGERGKQEEDYMVCYTYNLNRVSQL